MRFPRLAPALWGEVYTLFFEKEDKARGRLCMLLSGITNSIAANLTGGVFYTGFLLGNGIDITNIGIITALPYLASLLSIFSPMILERFQKRRWVLAGARLVYYFINIVLLTLMPMFVHDTGQKIFWFGVIVLAANAINFLFGSGYSVWHLNFIPNDVRASFFTMQQFCMNLLAGSVTVLSGIAADALSGSPQQLVIITALRYIGFVFAIVDVAVLCLPREYPYPLSGQNRSLLNVFRIPLKDKKFVHTMAFYCLYCAINNLTAGVLNAYLLSSVGVSYVQINFINVCYALFFILFSKAWQRGIRRFGWLKTFGFTCLCNAPTYLLYLFLQPGNAIWLFTLLRFAQHFLGIGYNVTAANLPYLNMPQEDRTSYMSFFNLAANMTILIAITAGTWFVAAVGDFTLRLGAVAFDGVQFLCAITALLCVASAVHAMRVAPKLEPAE